MLMRVCADERCLFDYAGIQGHQLTWTLWWVPGVVAEPWSVFVCRDVMYAARGCCKELTRDRQKMCRESGVAALCERL
jgi:hypothetical protein